MKFNNFLKYLSAGIIAFSAGCSEKINAVQKEELITTSPIYNIYKINEIYSNPIIIDSGHGGLDSGAYVDKISESSINYDISVRLKQALEKNKYLVYQTVFNKTLGFEPQKTLQNLRDSCLVYSNGLTFDLTTKGLDERCQVINQLRTEGTNPILISLHTNSTSSKAKGADIYFPANKDYCSIEGEITSKILSQRINSAFIKNKVPTDNSSKFESGEKFLDYLPVLSNVHSIINSNGFRLRIFSKTSLTNLETKVLIEVGNLKNSEDKKRLQNPDERQKIADSIAQGILDYDKNEGKEFYEFRTSPK